MDLQLEQERKKARQQKQQEMAPQIEGVEPQSLTPTFEAEAAAKEDARRESAEEQEHETSSERQRLAREPELSLVVSEPQTPQFEVEQLEEPSLPSLLPPRH